MTRLLKAAAAASLAMFVSTAVMAQTQNPDANPRPLPPDGQNTQPYDQKSEPTNAPKKAPGVGSRPMGPAQDEKSTDPNQPEQGTIKKLDKEGRGGQQN